MMAKKRMNHIKLGIFVIAGMAFLVLLLYIIGKNENLFGKTFVLKARFENVHGLMRGNNVRFGGIDAGTVSKVDVLNDTLFEVTLLVKTKFKNYIHKNARVNITTDGLMGNKLMNIVPSRQTAPLVQEGDILFSSESIDTDEMLKVLSNTNNDVAFIAKQLKQTVQRVNDSKALWQILSDETLPGSLKASLLEIESSAGNINEMTSQLNSIVADIKKGKGTVGELLVDSSIAENINDAIDKIRKVGVNADTLTSRINALVSSINDNVNNNNGTVNALLKDRQMKDNLAASMKNIEKATKAFNQNMEAIKHSFLFRGYFRRLEKQKIQDSTHVHE
jgi:phospholipid/cholesterol/gamma-HCH transport system substrate-binding protein